MKSCNIGIKIFDLRKSLNMSQGKLAKAIGVSQKAIDFWEKGINEPKASYVLLIARFFGVSCDYLLDNEQI